MKFYINVFIIIVIVVGILYEALLVLKRNRTIKVKGHDDFLTISLVMLFSLLIFPVNNNTTVIESFRNIFFLVFLFSTFSIKRGISEKGIEKVFFTITWDKIKALRVEEELNKANKIILKIELQKLNFKLQFHKHLLADLVSAIGNNMSEDDFVIQKSLVTDWRKK